MIAISMKNIKPFALLIMTSFSGLTPLMAQQGPPPALVEVAEASDELMSPQIYMPGTVVSMNDSRIASEITGRVTWVAPEGTLLRRGEVLAKIDARNINLTVERNETEIRRLTARIKFLKSDLERLRELALRKHTPLSRVEEAESNLLMTEQELAQAKINLEQSRIDLARTEVLAPFPGRVVARLAQIGEYAVPGREIARLVDTEHLEIRAQAPVTLSSVLTDGLAVTLTDQRELTSGQNTVLAENAIENSVIRAVVPVGDELSRTMEIRVAAPENKRYVVGSALQVGVPSSEPVRVVSVPRDALVLRREGTFVFRVSDDNTAERLAVRTGTANGTRVAVSGNIENGDVVIIRGGERLRPGQSLTIKEPVQATVLGR
ncbi:efflux RND transporter periplasmic adaptor subunit [Kordiimonas sp. SCSIO 12610]|uniref:efflux RND transporter periplasmic adaptor subunit n=1 Tax=Kordiimonas sp. SCSIO 12610 TaxID=2829597 RepID=UPI00210E31EF|nr:efflux RND transporter periplasmic adaptor subunit [Kordiimonas sp. SCSIO 12610]UTW54994.1 efflux RND transporter periplasmic adaptor subunit [Kordiimonas sp. SCSIO 12610]